MGLAQETAALLQRILGDRFTTSRGVCAEHATDISHFDSQPPDAVVLPETTEEVQAVVKACAATATPIVPYGAETSLEGNIHGLGGGVTMDLSRMNIIFQSISKTWTSWCNRALGVFSNVRASPRRAMNPVFHRFGRNAWCHYGSHAQALRRSRDPFCFLCIRYFRRRNPVGN